MTGIGNQRCNSIVCLLNNLLSEINCNSRSSASSPSSLFFFCTFHSRLWSFMTAELERNLINLTNGIIDGTTNELVEFINKPVFIPSFFEIINSNASNAKLCRAALVILGRSITANFMDLSDEEIETIKSSLLDLYFSCSDSEEQDIILGLIDKILDMCDLDNWKQLGPTIYQTIDKENTAKNAIMLLAQIIPKFSDDEIQENADNLLNITLEGLKAQDTKIVCSSVHIFLVVLCVVQSEKNVSQHLEILIELSGTIMDENALCNIWTEIDKAIYCNCFDDATLQCFVQNMVKIANNEELSVYTRFTPVQAISECIEKFNEEIFQQYLDIVFHLSSLFVLCENQIPSDFLDIVEVSLQKLPKITIYQMIKQRAVSFLQQQEYQYHVVAVYTLGIILSDAPDVAYKDVEFLITTFLMALNENNDLVSAAVCTALDRFDISFKTVDIFVLKFLPLIVPLLVSKNEDTRLYANDTFHTLCELIDTKVPGLFDALWNIKDKIPEDEIEGFIPYIATAIEKSEDFGDDEIDRILKYIEPVFQNTENYDLASHFLVIISTLISTTDCIEDELIPVAIPVLEKCLMNYDENGNEDSVIDCLGFISNVYKILNGNINESYNFKKYVDKSFEIASDREESESVRSEALYTCCLVAKKTKDSNLASDLQPLCCEAITLKEPSIYDIRSSVFISKLLGPEDAKQLFLTIVDFCKETNDSRAASEAIKPIVDFIKSENQQNAECFQTKAFELLFSFIQGNLKFMTGPLLSGKCDMILMTNIAYLISYLVSIPSDYIDQICKFMLEIIQRPDEPSLYSFIGAYSDAILYETASNEMVQALLQLIPNLVEEAQDPESQQNLSYLFNILVQKQPSIIQDIQSFIPKVWGWYENGKNQETGYQYLISNVASFFLTLYANGGEIDETKLNAALSEIPPFDVQETTKMIANAITILQNRNNSFETIKIVSRSFSDLLLMNEENLQIRKLNKEDLSNIANCLKQLVQSNSNILIDLKSRYSKSKSKLNRLLKLLH